MIGFLTEKTLSYISRKGAIKAEDEDVRAFYKYGIEITISSILNIVIIVILSLLFKGFYEGMTFLLVFIPTRQFTGGFHADTYFRCNLTFAVSFTATLFACRYTAGMLSVWTKTALLLGELILIAAICPIKNEHKPINERRQYIRCKALSIVLFMLFGCGGMAVAQYAPSYGNMALYSLHLIAVMGIIGILKGGKKDHEKAKQSSKDPC